MNCQFAVENNDPLRIMETRLQDVKVEIKSEVVEEMEFVAIKQETFAASEEVKFEVTSDAVKIENIDTKEQITENLVFQSAESLTSMMSPNQFSQTGDIDLTCTPFKCSFCNKSFRYNSSLNAHIRVHTKEKPFKCDVCNKSFAQKSDLSRHILVHRKEKAFKCDICNKSFSIKTSLNLHIPVHSNEKPYKCSVCSKSFSRKSYLNVHIHVHTNEKPYKCSVCCMSFSQMSTLYTHMHVHSNKDKETLICSICNKSFSSKWCVNRHLLRIHSKKN